MNTSPLTYSGAAALLGRHDRSIVDLVERLAGAGILLGGIVFPPVLGLVEAKNEGRRLLDGLLDKIGGRVRGLKGRERHELIAAAHTTLALSALFDAIAEHVGPRFAALEVSDAEKLQLAAATGDVVTQTAWVDQLTRVDIPLPSPACGFEENVRDQLAPRMEIVVRDAVAFFEGLQMWRHLRVDSLALRRKVVQRWEELYRDRYLRLAVDAPEFFIWAALGEQAATRFEIGAMGARISSVLQSHSETLGKLYDLLSLTVPEERPDRRSYRTRLSTAAAAVLQKPLLRSESIPDGLAFPSVSEGFITPRFRMAVAGPAASPSHESWWQQQPVQTGLDEFLAGYLAHPDAARLPLIVLGHPGAGKSLLSEVLAARLPAQGFTVVPVQLRRVNPEQRLLSQVESALRDLLHDTVTWGRLAEESGELTRVIILDGFDELVQATGATQSGYLAEVKRFQDEEHDLGRAVAVVVTSRTLVVDRARIPDGSVLVKLEEFDHQQISAWIANWNRANAHTEDFRSLTAALADRHRDLASQPLLLMMLALWAADPHAGLLDDAELSTAQLYERLLDSFIRRQILDKADQAPPPEHLPAMMSERRWRLSIAAFAMFNRGKQQVTEPDLDRDLHALTRQEPDIARNGFHTPLSSAQRTVADFFFIHVAHADQDSRDARRTYEFLHASFGEFLIAERIAKLVDGYAARRALYASDPSAHEPADDSMLRALLSHEPILQRRPIVEFLQQLAARRDTAQREQAQVAVKALLTAARTRAMGSYARYEPVPIDVVRTLAAYSANLVTLAMILRGGACLLTEMAPPGTEVLAWWRSTVRLWRSGLADTPWRSVVNNLRLTEPVAGEGQSVALTRNIDFPSPIQAEVADAGLLAADHLIAALVRQC